MTASSPHLVLIAGPNGAGKSTSAPILLRAALRVEEFVNADVIARGLSEFQPEGASMAAGKIMLARLGELARRRIDFAFETTLASRSFAPWIRDLGREGYTFSLVFLWLPDVDIAIARVKERVLGGGHAVPEETVRRRYSAGLRNFFGLYRLLASTWRFYDNGGSGPRLIACGSDRGETEVIDGPTWKAIQERHDPGA